MLEQIYKLCCWHYLDSNHAVSYPRFTTALSTVFLCCQHADGEKNYKAYLKKPPKQIDIWKNESTRKV